MKKKNKYSLGGQLLSAGVAMIPGVGQFLSPVVSIVDQQLAKEKLEKEQQILNTPLMQMNMNPSGNFAKGGVLNDQFKQYSTGSHSSGKDLNVDIEGNPDSNGQNSVQNNENSYRVGNEQYVFSDVLKFKGRPFNKLAMAINSKYPEARTIQDQRNALDLEMKMLAKKNDSARAITEFEKACGGRLKKDFGGILGDPIRNLPYVDINGKVIQPNNDQLTIDPILNNDLNIPKAYDPLDTLQPTDNNLALDTSSPINNQPLTLGRDLSQTSNPITPTTSVTKTVTPAKPGSIANGIGLGLKGLGLVGSIIDATQKPINEQLVSPDYQKSDLTSHLIQLHLIEVVEE